MLELHHRGARLWDADQAQEAGSACWTWTMRLVSLVEGGAGGWFHIACDSLPLLAVVEYLAVIKQVHMVWTAWSNNNNNKKKLQEKTGC